MWCVRWHRCTALCLIPGQLTALHSPRYVEVQWLLRLASSRNFFTSSKVPWAPSYIASQHARFRYRRRIPKSLTDSCSVHTTKSPASCCRTHCQKPLCDLSPSFSWSDGGSLCSALAGCCKLYWPVACLSHPCPPSEAEACDMDSRCHYLLTLFVVQAFNMSKPLKASLTNLQRSTHKNAKPWTLNPKPKQDFTAPLFAFESQEAWGLLRGWRMCNLPGEAQGGEQRGGGGWVLRPIWELGPFGVQVLGS